MTLLLTYGNANKNLEAFFFFFKNQHSQNLSTMNETPIHTLVKYFSAIPFSGLFIESCLRNNDVLKQPP